MSSESPGHVSSEVTYKLTTGIVVQSFTTCYKPSTNELSSNWYVSAKPIRKRPTTA